MQDHLLIRSQVSLSVEILHLRRIIIAYLELILEYCLCFYERQFKSETSTDNDLLKRFDKLLHDYYSEHRQYKLGLPTVRYCAQELFLSPGYFSDLIRQTRGVSASTVIRNHVMNLATRYLLSGKTVSETSDLLGFEYLQHFTRQFKKHYGITPSQYVKQNK